MKTALLIIQAVVWTVAMWLSYVKYDLWLSLIILLFIWSNNYDYLRKK